MSLMPRLAAGYYDDAGIWQRTKFCFVQCQHCNCHPPGNLYYSAAHDKGLQAERLAVAAPSPSMNSIKHGVDCACTGCNEDRHYANRAAGEHNVR
jgi:hypothetical protein